MASNSVFLRPQKVSSIFPFILALILFFNPALGSSNSSLDKPGVTYQSGYLFFKRAEGSFHSQSLKDALDYYGKAADSFGKIKEENPTWHPEAVSHWLEKCQKRISEIEKTLAERKSWEKPLRVHFLDVGQGDSALIQCPNGATIVIDGGRTSCYPFLVNYLRQAGVKQIDLMIATHPDGDHIGGLLKLIKTFPVDIILDSGKEHTTQLYQRYLETINASPDTKFRLGRAGDRYAFGEVELLILHPSSRLPKNNNDCSIMVKLRYGKESFMFTGDAEKRAEKEAMSRGFNLRSTVLKVGHHGSKSSTSPAFLASVSPRVAVISAGYNNRYGHPTPEVMRRLQSRGIEIYRTDLQGTILFSSNGKEHRLEFPGKAVYPDYDIAPEYEGKIIANRESLIYHLPEGRYYKKVPPEDREYFDTEAEAESAGYHKSWY